MNKPITTLLLATLLTVVSSAQADDTRKERYAAAYKKYPIATGVQQKIRVQAEQRRDKSSAELAQAKRIFNGKLSGDLAATLEQSIRTQSPLRSRFKVVVSDDEDVQRVQVVVHLDSTDTTSIAQLSATGAQLELVSQRLNKAQLWATAEQITRLAELGNVRHIAPPQYAQVRQGAVTTEGDAILRADAVRAMGLTGEGIKVGIISDGANNFSSAVATGDLPATLTRFGNCTTRAEDIAICRRALTCNEGTAMAEIIHDIAPDAELAVAAVSTDVEFVQRLDQLVNVFGADIIVDDLGFFDEPFFEDGPLAQAVAALPEDVLYVSSAGNSGHTHYEAPFRLAAAGSTLRLHEFGTNDTGHGFIIGARNFAVPILQWNAPFNNPNSDYDLYVSNGNTFVPSTEDQAGTPGTPPFEAVCLPNFSNSDAVEFAFVDQFAGGSARLEMFFLGALDVQYSIPQGSIFGHPGVPRAIAVGTINAAEPGNDEIAFYSSRGPSRIDFPALVNRAKPDLTGIDGVQVTGAGGFRSPFFGTSAAAPHVAGVAALLLSASRLNTAESVRDALEASAEDLGASGRDSIYGFGLVDTLEAKGLVKIGIPLPPFLLLLDDDEN